MAADQGCPGWGWMGTVALSEKFGRKSQKRNFSKFVTPPPNDMTADRGCRGQGWTGTVALSDKLTEERRKIDLFKTNSHVCPSMHRGRSPCTRTPCCMRTCCHQGPYTQAPCCRVSEATGHLLKTISLPQWMFYKQTRACYPTRAIYEQWGLTLCQWEQNMVHCM